MLICLLILPKTLAIQKMYNIITGNEEIKYKTKYRLSKKSPTIATLDSLTYL